MAGKGGRNHVRHYQACPGGVAEKSPGGKALEKITINDITEDCGISRMTFTIIKDILHPTECIL